jgi:hypothetical protein
MNLTKSHRSQAIVLKKSIIVYIMPYQVWKCDALETPILIAMGPNFRGGQAAFRVNVSASMLPGSVSASSRRIMRVTSNQVLPVPAEADTVALISGWAAVRLSTALLLGLFVIFIG